MTYSGGGTRVLHLIDQLPASRGAERPQMPEAALLACAALRSGLRDFRQDVCLIGGNALEARARAAGLPATDRIAPPLGLTARAIFGLRSYFRVRGEPDIIHCWSPGTLAAASAACASPLSATLLGRPGPPGFGAGRLRARSPRVMVCEGGRDWARALGVRDDAVFTVPLPCLDAHSSNDARARVRAILGLGSGDLAITLIGGEAETDILRLVFLLALLYESGARVVWLAPDSAARMARGLRFHARSSWPARVIVSGRTPVELIAAADIAVWLGGPGSDSRGEGPSPAGAMLIGMALRAGVPVVAPASPLIAPLYSGVWRARCLAFNGTSPELARKLLPLALSAAARRGVGSPGAETAASTRGGFERAIRDQWRACGSTSRLAYAAPT